MLFRLHFQHFHAVVVVVVITGQVQAVRHKIIIHSLWGSRLYLLLWIIGITPLSSSNASNHVLISVSCSWKIRHEKLECQSWMPVSSYADDIVKEFQAWRGFLSSQCDLLSIFFFFFDNQTGISTIHQLLNVSTSQGHLYSSATLGNVTRQSSVCHKLSEIIDACYSFVFFLVSPWAMTSFKVSLLIIQHGWFEWGCPPLSLILANQLEKGREVGMALNISARTDFDLGFRLP